MGARNDSPLVRAETRAWHRSSSPLWDDERGRSMPDYETPAPRYRRLARECLEVANNFPPGDQRDALLQMAQV
jgi:hypothetical protein